MRVPTERTRPSLAAATNRRCDRCNPPAERCAFAHQDAHPSTFSRPRVAIGLPRRLAAPFFEALLLQAPLRDLLRCGRRRAAAEAGRVIMIGRLMGHGDVLAPGPELLVIAEKPAHEHAVARPRRLVLSLDLLGLELLY